MKEKIKSFLKQNWLKTILVIIILIIVSGTFYWFQWRPTQIKKNCYNIAREKAIKKANITSYGKATGEFYKDDYDTYYKWCLQSKGL